MKEGIKKFLWRAFDLSVLFFLLDLTFKITERPFPPYPEPEFWGTIFLYIMVGSIIAGIPFVYRKFGGNKKEIKQSTKPIANS